MHKSKRKLTKEEIDRLYQCALRSLSSWGKVDYWDYLEEYLHEVAHGASFGMKFTARTPTRVSDRFDDINTRSGIVGLVEEARAFAVQSIMQEELGFPKLLATRMRKQAKLAWENGWPGQAFPRRTFMSLIEQFKEEDSTFDAALSGMRDVHRIVGKKED